MATYHSLYELFKALSVILRAWFHRHFPEKDESFDIEAFTVDACYPLVDRYVNWYAEHGMALPPEFERDPSEWTEVLRKIQRAFYLAATENHPESPLARARARFAAFKDDGFNKEALLSLQKEIDEGFMLFGQHLRHLKENSHARQ